MNKLKAAVCFVLFFYNKRGRGERKSVHTLIAQHYNPTVVISYELSKKGPSDSFLLIPKFQNSKPTPD